MPDVIIWFALLAGTVLLVICMGLLTLSFRGEWQDGGYRVAVKAVLADAWGHYVNIATRVMGALPRMGSGNDSVEAHEPREPLSSLTTFPHIGVVRRVTPSWHDR